MYIILAFNLSEKGVTEYFPIKYIKTPKSIETGSAGNACLKIAKKNRVSPRPTKMPI